MIKEEIREKYKEKRKGLTHSMNDEISFGIYQRLISNFDFKNKNISCFVPIDRFNEVITWHILDGVDAKIYLPVLADNYELKHIRYEGKDKLKKNSWGILEPVAGEEITAGKFDFVLVPLLTIDNKGYRVGYGKGYYDKFLAECSSDCKFIGLYQFDEIETIDDIHDADVPLHFCVTPKNVLKFPLIKGS